MKCDHPCGRRIRIKDFVTKLCFHMFAVWQLCVDIMIKCDYYLIVLFGNANYIIPFNCSG